MWFIYSLSTAVIETSKDLLGRSKSKKLGEYTAAFSYQVFSIFIVVPIFLLFGSIPETNTLFWVSVGLGMMIKPIWIIAYMKAIKYSDLSIVLPLLSLSPIITALISLFTEDKTPSLFGAIGIITVCVGIYLINFSQTIGNNLLLPFTNILKDQGSRWMVISVLVTSLGSNVSKIQTTASDPIFSLFVTTFTGSFMMALIVIAKKQLDISAIRSNFKQLSLLGILNGLSNAAIRLALKDGYTPYVFSVKRLNIVFGSIIGMFKFKEKIANTKLLGLVLVVLGIVGMAI